MAGKNMTKTNRPIRRRVTFLLEDEPGKVVAVAGSFNDWLPDQAARRQERRRHLHRHDDARTGVYEYKFVINGEWKIDERNPNFVPNDIGSLNSVLELESK